MPTQTPPTHLRSRLRCALLVMLLAGATAVSAQVRVLINPGDQGEQSRYAVFGAWKAAIEQALRKEKLGPTVVQLSTDATADLGVTRSRIPDIFIAPAHVIGSAVRYGYTPVLGLDRPVQAVLVAPKDSPVTNLAQARGKRLGLPLQDSVVTYLLRGEVNASNTTVKRHFGTLYETRYQDALLSCLQLKRCELVAVERAVFDRWIAAGESLKIVMETKTAPGVSVAIKDGVKPGPVVLRAAMTESLGAVPGSEDAKVVALAKADFDYVATLGYFTPRSLPGVTLVEAKDVTQLMQSGGSYIDTRTEAEFKAGHVPGAKLVPYVEKSAKDADFKAEEDKFDITKLPSDKTSALIFACNGAECWKSFKASYAANKAGYTKVHWFRGGFPEWRAAGLKVETTP